MSDPSVSSCNDALEYVAASHYFMLAHSRLQA